MIKKYMITLALLLIFCMALTGCDSSGVAGKIETGKSDADAGTVFPEEMYVAANDGEESEILFDETIPLSGSPAAGTAIVPTASGTVVYTDKAGNDASVVIDASNSAQGYVMIKYTGKSGNKLKVIITGPSGVKYTYNLRNDGQYETFGMSDGNGEYTIAVYQNISDNKYSTLFSKAISVTMKDPFAPFLIPNQYVNYSASSAAVAKAKELTSGCVKVVDKVNKIYSFIIDNFIYDKAKAQTVQSGYLPDVDTVLAAKKGICFDYAAVITAMLRSQGVPTKLVVGYTGEQYHAWISTYSEDSGWVEGIIFFDGKKWKLMDPTFASGADSSEAIMDYIKNEANYHAKYIY